MNRNEYSGLPVKSDDTELVRRRYDRIAPVYDLGEWMMELRARAWRRDLWAQVGGDRILELGVGTGKNIRFYPSGKDITAIDISERMLARAERKAERLDSSVRLELADAQALPYADAAFDTVVATFLFCSVPAPVRALEEARRVLKPGGQLLLLEHVLSKNLVLRRLMKWFDPIPFRIWGAHIDRETVKIISAAGFEGLEVINLSLDIVKKIVAK